MTASDVCLLLEGTYPFVRGGVSAWVHQIVRGLTDLSFALVFVGSRRCDYGEAKYELPGNVRHFEAHYLEDAYAGRQPCTLALDESRLEAVRGLHEYLRRRAEGEAFKAEEGPRLDGCVDDLLATLETPGGIGADEFLGGTGAWELIREAHLNGGGDAAFVDYFWTLRILHGPIFQLARVAAAIPEARAYHTVSTGYAGLLGAFVERRRRRPLILSEHGIYTKERRIDLNQADWLDRLSSGAAGACLRQLWIRCFESFGRLTYRAANPIVSLYAGNRERQQRDGAAPERTRIIVNGVDLQRFEPVWQGRARGPVPQVVGLIGRIVPIKDVKTFVRAMALVARRLPAAEGWVIGGADEDSAYGDECQLLAQSLGLGERVKFLGHQDVTTILPRLGVLMLTSISEAQPLAVLEALAAGVPCVTTDVGACREQIEGADEADRALGQAGRVVPFADHEALSRAAIELLSDPDLHAACQAAGRERVRRYYGEERMLEAYREVYREAVGRDEATDTATDARACPRAARAAAVSEAAWPA